MKKLILMASAALAFGGVAYAQDSSMAPATGTSAPDATAQPGATPDMGPQTAPATPDASGGMTAPPAGGDMSGGAMPPAGGDMSGGAMPANGGAMPPSGSATGPNGPVSMTPTQGPTDLPMCSRTVTDNCKQGGKSGSHKAMRHHKK